MPTGKTPVIDFEFYIHANFDDLHKAVHNLVNYGVTKEKVRGEVTKAFAEMGIK